MKKKKGMQVQGWFAALEVRKNEEVFTLGFTKTTYGKIKKTTEIKPLGLVQGFLKAVQSPESLLLWEYNYGVEDDIFTLQREAEKIERLLNAFFESNRQWKKKYGTDKTKNVFQYVEQHHLNDLRIISDLRIWDFNQNFVFTAESIIPLLWYEVIENIRQKNKFNKCSCGKWYVLKSRHQTNHCPECPPPSHRYSAKRKEYMRSYRKKKQVKRIKRDTVKKGITPEQKGIIRAYKDFYGKKKGRE